MFDDTASRALSLLVAVTLLFVLGCVAWDAWRKR